MILTICIFTTTLIFSLFNIIKWKLDSNKTSDQIDNIQENTVVQEKEDTPETEIVEQEEEIPKENPYWDYIKMNMIDVDFSDLKKINSNVRGWIKVNGTDITRSPYNIIHNELGIKKCRFYDLRGNYATKILNNGVELRDVADILGHKNVETTENFYISSTSDSRKYATEVFDSIIKSDVINEIIKYEI